MIERICVFCGSSPGARPVYARAARELGLALVARKIQLVYGGGRVGLMGELARTVLDAGGGVTGVIPQQLVDRELAFAELEDLRIVASMHERKALMAQLADGFIALPGGLGTVEEFFEVLTWAQLGIHRKPCGLIDVDATIVRSRRSSTTPSWKSSSDPRSGRCCSSTPSPSGCSSGSRSTGHRRWTRRSGP